MSGSDNKTLLSEQGNKVTPGELAKEVSLNLENKTYLLEKEQAFFIPTYTALVVKSFKNLNLKEGILTLFGTLVIRMSLAGVHDKIVDSIKEKLGIRFNEAPKTLSSDEDGVTIKHDKGKKLLVYTYRFETEVNFLANISSIPFDTFVVPFQVEMTSSYIDIEEDGKTTSLKYRFNVHQHQHKTKTLSFKKECDKLAEYEIAYPLCEIKLPKESKRFENKEEKMQSYTYYPIMRFEFKFVREPWHMLMTVIFPLVILDVITLAVFATESDLASKIGNIATLVLALIAYLPSIRSEVPSVAYFTLCDTMVYSCLLINGLALLDGILLHYIEKSVITKVIFSCAGFLFIVLCFYVFVKCIKHLQFKKRVTAISLIEVKQASNEFIPSEWCNKELQTMAELKPIIVA